MRKANFKFKEKEGKFFAPIVQIVDKKTISNGMITTTPVPKSGTKGVYAMVRLSTPGGAGLGKKELYAISTETFTSSR